MPADAGRGAPHATVPASTVTDGDSKTATPPVRPASEPAPARGPLPPDEFAHIPSRRPRPPIIAIAALLLAVFLGYRLRHDVRFALSSSTPLALSDARALARLPLDRVPLHRYVRLEGTPERESAVILDTQGSWNFSQLFRLRATGGRVFVRRVADPVPVALAEGDQFVGRLVPFSDLSFSRSIDSYFGSRVTATHFFRPAELLQALSRQSAGRGGGLQLTDLAGDEVKLAPSDRLHVDIDRPDELRVELTRSRFPTKSAAAAAITNAGGRVVSDSERPDRWLFEVAVPPAPAARETVLSALGDLDRGARLRRARHTIEAAVADLAAADQSLTIKRPGGGETFAMSRLASVRTRAPVKVPPGALLLLEGERPRDAWKSVVVLAFLVAFFAVNLLALRRPS